jgi:hypothetical protein
LRFGLAAAGRRRQQPGVRHQIRLVEAHRHLAPFPALASIGWDDGETLLVDLERIGSLALTGDTVRCADLLRFLAAELSYNRWSDGVRVTLVGAGEEFVEVHPERISYAPAFDDVGTRLEAFLEQTQATAADLATSGLLAGRVDDIAGDAWMPEVLLLAGPLPPADAEHLAGLLGRLDEAGRGALAVVITNDPTAAHAARWTVTIDADGTLTRARARHADARPGHPHRPGPRPGQPAGHRPPHR